MTRKVQFAINTSKGRPAHWGIFIPTTGMQGTGKIIHVVGSPATGFNLQFKRN
ncbi:hypothetical protein FQN49_008988 [Arthroderma sp. PD_2]|nr:hypothetical protein FQN49_008988 [Arthroderma sp. PD_2]